MRIALADGYSVVDLPGEVHRYLVSGGSRDYKVTLDPAWHGARCSCPAGIFQRKKGKRCKHEVMVREAVTVDVATTIVVAARRALAPATPITSTRPSTARTSLPRVKAPPPAPAPAPGPAAQGMEADIAALRDEILRFGSERNTARRVEAFASLRAKAMLFREVLAAQVGDLDTKIEELCDAMTTNLSI